MIMNQNFRFPWSQMTVSKVSSIFRLLKQAVKGDEQD